MFGQVIIIAFWAIFSAAALPAAVLLLGTMLRSGQLTTGRAHVDDGSDDPESVGYRVYALSRDSDTLLAGAVLAAMPLLAGFVIAAFGKTVAADLAGLGMAAASFLVARTLRLRHARLEDRFEAISGISVSEASACVIERRPLPVPFDDRPAPSA